MNEIFKILLVDWLKFDFEIHEFLGPFVIFIMVILDFVVSHLLRSQ